MDELIDEQRRQFLRAAAADEIGIGGFERLVPHQLIAEGDKELPVLSRVRVLDRRDFAWPDRPARLSHESRIKRRFGVTCVVGWNQLRACKVKLEEIIGKHQPAAGIAVEQMMSTGNPEILHCRPRSASETIST